MYSYTYYVLLSYFLNSIGRYALQTGINRTVLLRISNSWEKEGERTRRKEDFTILYCTYTYLMSCIGTIILGSKYRYSILKVVNIKLSPRKG